MNKDYIEVLNKLKELCSAKKQSIDYKNCSDEQASEWRMWDWYVEFLDKQITLAAEGWETNGYAINEIKKELGVDLHLPKLELNESEREEKEKPLMFF